MHRPLFDRGCKPRLINFSEIGIAAGTGALPLTHGRDSNISHVEEVGCDSGRRQASIFLNRRIDGAIFPHNLPQARDDAAWTGGSAHARLVGRA